MRWWEGVWGVQTSEIRLGKGEVENHKRGLRQLSFTAPYDMRSEALTTPSTEHPLFCFSFRKYIHTYIITKLQVSTPLHYVVSSLSTFSFSHSFIFILRFRTY